MNDYSDTYNPPFHTEEFTYTFYHLPTGKSGEKKIYALNRFHALDVINHWNETQIFNPPHWMYVLRS